MHACLDILYGVLCIIIDDDFFVFCFCFFRFGKQTIKDGYPACISSFVTFRLASCLEKDFVQMSQ